MGGELTGEGMYVYLQLTHVVQQKLSQYCKQLYSFFFFLPKKDRWVVSLSVRATKRWAKLGAGRRFWIGCLHIKGKLTAESFAISGRWLTLKGQSLLGQQDPRCQSIRNTPGYYSNREGNDLRQKGRKVQSALRLRKLHFRTQKCWWILCCV